MNGINQLRCRKGSQSQQRGVLCRAIGDQSDTWKRGTAKVMDVRIGPIVKKMKRDRQWNQKGARRGVAIPRPAETLIMSHALSIHHVLFSRRRNSSFPSATSFPTPAITRTSCMRGTSTPLAADYLLSQRAMRRSFA